MKSQVLFIFKLDFDSRVKLRAEFKAVDLSRQDYLEKYRIFFPENFSKMWCKLGRLLLRCLTGRMKRKDRMLFCRVSG